MRVVSVSYNPKKDQSDPHKWLQRIDFYMGALEFLSQQCEVINVDLINWQGELEQKGVKHIFLDKSASFIKVNRFVKQLGPDIVLVHGFLFSTAVMHLGLICKNEVKIILQHHAELPFTGRRSIVFKAAGGFVDAYFFATRSMGAAWQQNKLVYLNKPIIEIPEASSVFSSVGNIQKDPDMFLWVGRMNANKDPLTLIKAFGKFCKLMPNAKLYMIFKTKELLTEVGSFIKETKLETNIILVGEVSRNEMRSWFEKASFIICSSYYEGCNISVLEGMSCGCIPITTKIPSFELHTAHFELGSYFTPGNDNELLQCLLQATNMDVAAERKKVVDHFQDELSFKAIAKKMYKAFVDLSKLSTSD